MKQKLEIKEYKNKYRLAAEEIYSCLGINNYSDTFSCMTRFRAEITDKSLVDIDGIKNIKLVKGINWAGSQLQIIIGGEVIKVLTEFNKYESELKNPITKDKTAIKIKKTIGAKIMGFLGGVMAPSIPILMASCMFSAIYALLSIPSASVLTTKLADGTAIDIGNITQFDIWSALFFVLNKVLLNAIGLFFIFNTAKYLKGNVWFALGVGVILMYRSFFPSTIGVPLVEGSFGQWITDANSGKSGFLLFNMGGFPITIAGYEGAIIPYIVGGAVVTYLDKWIQKWMPTTIDIIFRPVLVVGITIFGLWFLLAPIASLVEFGLSTAMKWFATIPYGFGTAIMGFLWQPIVLTGCHVAAAMGLLTEMITTGQSLGLVAIQCGVWAQVGAVIGVILVTKNNNLKKVAIGSVAGGIFGVTEPIIYGVTLPKMKPFLWGCVGGAIGGFLSGILNVYCDKMGGSGIFAVLSVPVDIIWKVVLVWGLSVVASAILVAVFYTERKNELSYFNKGVNKFIKLVSGEKEIIKVEFKDLEIEIKGMKLDYKKMGKYYSDVSKYEQQMITLENQESKHRQKLYKELIKLKSKLEKKENQELLDKFNKTNDQYLSYNLDNEKNELQLKLDKVINTNKQLVTNFNFKKENIYNNSCTKLTSYSKNANSTNDVLTIKNIFWNALNSVEIGYGIEDAKPIKFKKGEK